MKIIIDGKEVNVQEGVTIRDFLPEKKNEFIIAVKKTIDVKSVITNLYEVITTKGKMIIKWECEKALDKWRQIYKNFEGCKVRWATNEAIAFGPTITNFKPSIKEVELKKNEVTISLSGMSSEESHLIFSKKLHTGLYFPPNDGDVMGRVVYGKHLLDFLKIGDMIKKISPIIEKRGGFQLIRANLDYIPNDGDEIITKMEINLDYESPKNGEHLYNMLENGFFVSRKTSRFIAYDKQVVSLESEKIGVRERGIVSIRNNGNKAGSIYIYINNAPISMNHTIVGKVVRGLEIADVALEGDKIDLVINPIRIELLGRTQKEASLILEKLGIKHIRDGDERDDAIIVDHSPSTTLEIFKKKEVICKGVPKERILKIKLYRNLAPSTIDYFEKVSNINIRKIGKLKVFFTTKDVVLFKGNLELGKILLPENIPKDFVSPGIIGVTNSVKKYSGIIGIRISKSDRFGPTAEGFEGSNIIGEVIEGLENLKNVKENDEVYIMEVDK
ncbi:MAG: methanogenesis marker 3 protein [Candidatus Methanomethylicaceae archaeon]